MILETKNQNYSHKDIKKAPKTQEKAVEITHRYQTERDTCAMVKHLLSTRKALGHTSRNGKIRRNGKKTGGGVELERKSMQ